MVAPCFVLLAFILLASPSAAACTVPAAPDRFVNVRVEEAGRVIYEVPTSITTKIASCTEDTHLYPPQFDGRYVVWREAQGYRYVDLDGDRTPQKISEGTLGDGYYLRIFLDDQVTRLAAENLGNGSRFTDRIPLKATFVGVHEDMALGILRQDPWHDPFSGMWLWDGSTNTWIHKDGKVRRPAGLESPIVVAFNERWMIIEDRSQERRFWAIEHATNHTVGPFALGEGNIDGLNGDVVYLVGPMQGPSGQPSARALSLPSGQATEFQRFSKVIVGDRVATRVVGASTGANGSDDASERTPIWTVPTPFVLVVVAFAFVAVLWRRRA